MRFFGSLLLAALLSAAPSMYAASPQGSRAASPQAGDAEQLGALAQQYAETVAATLPGHFTIHAARRPVLPPMKPGKLTFEPERLSKQEPLGRFFVIFRVYVDGIFTTTTRVEMEGAWSGNLYRAKSALQRKTVIAEDTLETFQFEGMPPAGAVKDLPKDVRLRQPMNIGRVLTNMDLEPIPLINATDRVRVTLKNGGLHIQGDATARSSGAKGDTVRLEMDGTKKLVQGTVTGPCQATVTVASY